MAHHARHRGCQTCTRQFTIPVHGHDDHDCSRLGCGISRRRRGKERVSHDWEDVPSLKIQAHSAQTHDRAHALPVIGQVVCAATTARKHAASACRATTPPWAQAARPPARLFALTIRSLSRHGLQKGSLSSLAILECYKMQHRRPMTATQPQFITQPALPEVRCRTPRRCRGTIWESRTMGRRYGPNQRVTDTAHWLQQTVSRVRRESLTRITPIRCDVVEARPLPRHRPRRRCRNDADSFRAHRN